MTVEQPRFFDQPSFFDDPVFDGATYVHHRDSERLGEQLRKVYEVMSNGEWWAPAGLERATGYSWASIGARIRDLRKERFGSHVIERKYIHHGMFWYRLVVS